MYRTFQFRAKNSPPLLHNHSRRNPKLLDLTLSSRPPKNDKKCF